MSDHLDENQRGAQSKIEGQESAVRNYIPIGIIGASLGILTGLSQSPIATSVVSALIGAALVALTLVASAKPKLATVRLDQVAVLSLFFVGTTILALLGRIGGHIGDAPIKADFNYLREIGVSTEDARAAIVARYVSTKGINTAPRTDQPALPGTGRLSPQNSGPTRKLRHFFVADGAARSYQLNDQLIDQLTALISAQPDRTSEFQPLRSKAVLARSAARVGLEVIRDDMIVASGKETANLWYRVVRMNSDESKRFFEEMTVDERNVWNEINSYFNRN